MTNVNAEEIQVPGLIAVAENMPPIVASTDAEVDLEVLRSVPKQFSIGDEKTANWLVKKIIAARQYASNVKRWADLELKRAEREEECLMFLFGRQIERWAREEIEKLGGKRKSISLPSGTIGFRTVKSHLVVKDEIRLMQWARTNCPAAIQTTEKLAKTPVNEHFTITGEIPDGTHLEPDREAFRIS
jgi:hypothetical protein